VNKENWVPEYKVFSHENGLEFSKRVGIFSKINVSLKKVFTFYVGLLMQLSLKVSPECMPSTPPDSPLIKFRYSFICQGTSTRRQRRELFGLRVKLSRVTTSLTTQT